MLKAKCPPPKLVAIDFCLCGVSEPRADAAFSGTDVSESQKFGSRIDAVLLRGASSDSTFSAVSLFARDLR